MSKKKKKAGSDNVNTTPAETLEPGMKLCPHCKAKISEKAYYCFGCGKAVFEEASLVNTSQNTAAPRSDATLIVTRHEVDPKAARRDKIITALLCIAIAVVVVIIIINVVTMISIRKKTEASRAEKESAMQSQESMEPGSIPTNDLSRRPIPDEDMQTALIGGYCVRIPSQSWMYYTTNFEDKIFNNSSGYSGSGYGYLTIIYTMLPSEEEGAASEYSAVIENAAIGEEEFYPDQESFYEAQKGEDGYEHVEKLQAGDLVIEHYRAKAEDAGQGVYYDLYLTVKNNEGLSISLKGGSDKPYKEIIDSITYIGGGTYDQGVLFVRNSDDLKGIDMTDIENGDYVFENIIGNDIGSFMKELDDFGTELTAFMTEYEKSSDKKAKEDEYNGYIEKCRDYVRKITAIKKLGTPTNYMVGIKYGEQDLGDDYQMLIYEFLYTIDPYYGVGELLPEDGDT
ncbi:MAG: zinc ribbon domain-containing protein [Lachnospiraceae bacterium]|nr:zinc ribbon domain-containing protein [Lachnospiraceae bacterium]